MNYYFKLVIDNSNSKTKPKDKRDTPIINMCTKVLPEVKATLDNFEPTKDNDIFALTIMIESAQDKIYFLAHTKEDLEKIYYFVFDNYYEEEE